MVSIPGSGRSPGEGNGSPLQYSCLENPTDRRHWQATVHGVTSVGHNLATKERERTHTHTHTHTHIHKWLMIRNVLNNDLNHCRYKVNHSCLLWFKSQALIWGSTICFLSCDKKRTMNDFLKIRTSSFHFFQRGRCDWFLHLFPCFRKSFKHSWSFILL